MVPNNGHLGSNRDRGHMEAPGLVAEWIHYGFLGITLILPTIN